MTHRGSPSVRGVSKGPIIAACVVAVSIAAVFGWLKLSNHAASNDRQAASACVEGTSVLNVTADPDIAAVVRRIADRYNATGPNVKDHCAKVVVTDRPSQPIAAALTATAWDDAALGPRPALWIPQSARWIQQIRVPGLIEGEPHPIAASPIVLAVSEPLRTALTDAKVGWAALPKLQQGSLAEVGLGSWGSLGLALPPGDAALAATAAVAAAVAGEDPVSDDAAKSAPVVAAVGGLAAAAPAVPTTPPVAEQQTPPPVADRPSAPPGASPLTVLAAQTDPAAAGMHAVAATEQQVRAVGGRAVAFRPLGTAPIADYPAAILSGSWIDETQNQIAGLFSTYLSTADQRNLFVDAGFQPAGPVPPLPSKTALDQLTATMTHPVLGVYSTVLLDVTSSMSEQEDNGTRLTNVVAALRSELDTVPADSGVGLWLVGKNLDGVKPYRIARATGLLDEAERAEFTAALRTVQPTVMRSDNSYPALEVAYQAAVTGYTANLANSVLLITSGPNDDSDVTGEQLLTTIASSADKAKPVRVDVVVLSDSDSATMQTLARNTGGSYTRVSGTASPNFGVALGKALAP